jgi:acetyl esterase/lipase
VARLKQCDNISALAKELGVHRRLLYTWRDKLEPIEQDDGPPAASMREDNLLARQPRAFVVTTDSDHDLDVYLNLASRMTVTGRPCVYSDLKELLYCPRGHGENRPV